MGCVLSLVWCIAPGVCYGDCHDMCLCRFKKIVDKETLCQEGLKLFKKIKLNKLAHLLNAVVYMSDPVSMYLFKGKYAR